MGKKRALDGNLTSEDESSKIIKQCFKNLLNGSAKKHEDYLVIQYQSDGFLFLCTPQEILKFITPRYSYGSTYEGKDRLEQGMRVRCEWDERLRFCKATILHMSPDQEEMTRLYKELKAREPPIPCTQRSKRFKKVSATQVVEDQRVKRTRINNFDLFGTAVLQPVLQQQLATEPVTESQLLASAPIVGSQPEATDLTLDEYGYLPNWTFDGDDNDRDFFDQHEESTPRTTILAPETQEPDDSLLKEAVEESLPQHSSTLNNDEQMEDSHRSVESQTDIILPQVSEDKEKDVLAELLLKLHYYRQKADRMLEKKPLSEDRCKKLVFYAKKISKFENLLAYRNRIKSHKSGLPRTKGGKICFETMEFSFMKKPEDEDLPSYRDIGGNGTLWVRKVDIDGAKRESRDLKEYSIKLLWEFLFTTNDLVLARQKKQRSVAFAKLFGEANTRALYGHLCDMRSRMMKKHPKWAEEMPSMRDFLTKWRHAYDDRLRSIII